MVQENALQGMATKDTFSAVQEKKQNEDRLVEIKLVLEKLVCIGL